MKKKINLIVRQEDKDLRVDVFINKREIHPKNKFKKANLSFIN